MKVSHALLAILATTGCSSPPSDRLLPTASVDSVSPAFGAAAVGPPTSASSAPVPVRSGPRPCGYHIIAGTPPDHTHRWARITYNAAGLDVLEEAVGDDHELAFRHASDYDAMGNLAHHSATAGGRPAEQWLVYDSFGRLLRHSGDDDDGSDGHEDWWVTYQCDNDRNPIAAHLELEINDKGVAAIIYDRTYRYDEHARLIELDRARARPDGLPGVVDQISRYTYDEDSRETKKTVEAVKDGKETEVGSSTTRYDLQNHVLSMVEDQLDAGSWFRLTDTYSYESGRLLSKTSIVVDSSSESVVATTQYVLQYDHCQ